MVCNAHGADGGIWQSGRGPAIDSAGDIYFETGNGDWDGRRDFGTSVVKLKLGGDSLEVDDYFTPSDFKLLNDRDADLGSTGPMLGTGNEPHDRRQQEGHRLRVRYGEIGHMTPDGAGVVQTFENNGGRILAGPALWDGPTGRTFTCGPRPIISRDSTSAIAAWKPRPSPRERSRTAVRRVAR